MEHLVSAFIDRSRRAPSPFALERALLATRDLFSLHDLNRLLSNPLLTPDWVRLSLNGKPVELDSEYLWKIVQKRALRFLDKSLLSNVLSRGGALVLEGIDILSPKVNRLCDTIDGSLPCAFSNCEAFYSQQNNEAYTGHCDSDDVFVFQVSGRKKWEMFTPQNRRYIGNSPLTDKQLGARLEEIILYPGDVLFVRAGVPHRCTTPGDHSLHLSFDLCDRSPNIEQITHLANERHNARLPEMFASPNSAIKHYQEILDSRSFQMEVETLLENTRSQASAFRQRILTAHTVTGLYCDNLGRDDEFGITGAGSL